MIKRIYNIARSNVSHFLRQRAFENLRDMRSKDKDFSTFDKDFEDRKATVVERPPHLFAEYYANLEIPPGSTREEVKASWKRLMKRYHPDLHSTDREKRETANELARRLTEAYQILDRELMDKN